jgi:hypothetical protein
LEVLLGDLAEHALPARPGTCPQHVDRALFLSDRVEQAVQIVQVGRIALHAGEAPASGTQDITPLCPFIAAAVEIPDPQHPAPQYARDYKKAVAARLAETAREAGATNPEQLGEQLALLLDGASARTRVLNTNTFPTAAAIAAVLINNAIPTTAQWGGGIHNDGYES